jgi:cobalamin biosynthesis Mg chelatase CobN
MAAETHAEPACVAWDDCKETAVASFEVAAGTRLAHPVCRLLTVCTVNQREVVPPTATSDRKCGDTTSTTTITTVTSTTSATSITATETTSTITTATGITSTITQSTETTTTATSTSTTSTTFTTIESSGSATTAPAGIAVGLGVPLLLIVLVGFFFHNRRRRTQDGQGSPPANLVKGSAARETPRMASNPL